MKKIPLIATLFLLALCALSCKEPVPPEPEVIPVREVLISRTKASVKIGQTLTLTADVQPVNATDAALSWSSDDTSVATVDAQGTVTGIAEGMTSIVVKAGGKSDKCELTVLYDGVRATGIHLSAHELTIKSGIRQSLPYTVEPEHTTETVSWSSEDPSVVSIEAGGVLVGGKVGTTVITARIGSFEDRCTVTVIGDTWLSLTDPLEKVIPRMDYPDRTDTVRVARGETATLQVIIHADKGATGLTPRVRRFARNGEGIAVEPGFWWVRKTKCTRHWDSWEGGPASDEINADFDLYPDCLMPLGKWDVTIEPGDRSCLWVEFDIPRDLEPGVYEGELEVSGTDVASFTATKRFWVQVYPATLPQKQGLTVINWVHEDLRAMNGGQYTDKNRVFELLENAIIPFMNRYGQNCYRFMYANRGNIGRAWTEYDASKGRYRWVYDFDYSFGKEFELFLRACPQLAMVHGLNIIAGRDGDAYVMLGYKLGEDGKPLVDAGGEMEYGYYDIDGTKEEPAVEMYMEDFFGQFQDWLESHKLADGRTWLDIYAQTVQDEPGDAQAPAYNQLARYLKRAAPKIKTLEPIGTNLIDDTLLDYPCPTIAHLTDMPARGNQVQWTYTCMGPQGNYANRFIRLPLIKTRILHWINYRYNAVGYLHWGLCYWYGCPDGDPYKDAYDLSRQYSGSFIGGDMFIVYPGDGELYPSVRLCAMRDGIRDYDLLRMIEARSKSDADAFCQRFVMDNATYDTDISHFRALRREMLEYLSR